MVLIRRRGATSVFASVIEAHGSFSEPQERSTEASGRLQEIKIVATSLDGIVAEIIGEGGIHWTVMVANGTASTTAAHRVGTFTWTGNYSVAGIQKAR